MSHYILAGCQPWNMESMLRFKSQRSDEITIVSTPEELLLAIDEVGEIDYIFFYHWSHIIPENITRAYECVCFHMTDVPYGRGGSPLQNLIANGKRNTKLTALKMCSELDAGPVYLKRDLSLEGSSAEEIYVRAGELSYDMILEIVEKKPVPVDQVGEVVKFARRKPEMSVLPDSGDLEKIYDHIRMLDAEGYPKAFIEVGDYRIEFNRATRYSDKVEASVVIIKK